MNLDFLLDDVIKNRRALHQIPEVALNEFHFDENALLTGIEMFAKIYHNFK